MDAIDRIFDRTVAEVIVKEELAKKLRSGRPLRLKLGLDPSKPDLHLGHAVCLRKLRQLQEMGHQVVLIVGDWTAQIGDPSGRDVARQMLSSEEVQRNAETYMQQFYKVVDRERTEVRWQSEWFSKFTLADVFNLTSRFTMAQMLAHETFRQRFDQGRPLSLMELMYPLLQAYDSVAIKADVEFGGTDQKFNILAGRELLTSLALPPQDVFLVHLLPGTDGQKMSKSLGNTIDFTDSPDAMYGKIMSVSDASLDTYVKLVTDMPDVEAMELRQALSTGKLEPMDVKMRVARDLVRQFHGQESADAAEAEFVRVHRHRQTPTDIPTFSTAAQPVSIIELLLDAGLANTSSEARRLVMQGGVKIDDEKVEDFRTKLTIKHGAILRVGKLKFVRIVHD